MDDKFKRNSIKIFLSNLIGYAILFSSVKEANASAGLVFGSPYTFINPANMSLVEKFSLTLDSVVTR